MDSVNDNIRKIYREDAGIQKCFSFDNSLKVIINNKIAVNLFSVHFRLTHPFF